MNDLELIQAIFHPLFPKLLGIDLVEVSPQRVLATRQVRADLCTTGENTEARGGVSCAIPQRSTSMYIHGCSTNAYCLKPLTHGCTSALR